MLTIANIAAEYTRAGRWLRWLSSAVSSFENRTGALRRRPVLCFQSCVSNASDVPIIVDPLCICTV
jgi:hypothetical protein